MVASDGMLEYYDENTWSWFEEDELDTLDLKVVIDDKYVEEEYIGLEGLEFLLEEFND